MADTNVPRLTRLRGSLPSEEPGARGLEGSARNPGCTRRKALAIAGVNPATVAEQVYDAPVKEGQSPFALAIGIRFEQNLFEHGGAKFLKLYREENRLSPSECKVAVVPDMAPGIGAVEFAKRRAETERLFEAKLRGDPTAPNVIIKPRLPVHLLGIPHDTEPDTLVAADKEPFYRPVELKSFPNRRGKTSPADLRGALRQTAVAAVGMRLTLERLDVSNPKALVPDIADLVLRKPGSAAPTLETMTMEAEVFSLTVSLNEAPRNLDELEEMVDGGSLDDRSVLDSIPTNYNQECKEHCPLASVCKQQAVEVGDPVLLGNRAREELASAGSIGRALELLHSRGAPPRTSEEAALQAQLQQAHAEFRKAVGHGV